MLSLAESGRLRDEQIAIHPPAYFQQVVLQEGLNMLLHTEGSGIRIAIADSLKDFQMLFRRDEGAAWRATIVPHHPVPRPELQSYHRGDRRN